MAKKDRSRPPGASPAKRAKSPSPDPRALLTDNLRITRAPKKSKPSDLNNQVTVHIISVPSDDPPAAPAPTPPATPPAAPPAAGPAAATTPAAKPSIRLVHSPAPTAAQAAAQAPAPQPNLPPAPRAAAMNPATGPTAPTAPTASMAPGAPADRGSRRDTPPAGTAFGSPTPVHKSALNLSPMEQMLWSARLQKAKDVVAAQMKVQVNSGKLVRRYTALDHDDGLFEIETAKGFYVVVLSKTGEYSIYWRHDRKAY